MAHIISEKFDFHCGISVSSYFNFSKCIPVSVPVTSIFTIFVWRILISLPLCSTLRQILIHRLHLTTLLSFSYLRQCRIHPLSLQNFTFFTNSVLLHIHRHVYFTQHIVPILFILYHVRLSTFIIFKFLLCSPSNFRLPLPRSILSITLAFPSHLKQHHLGFLLLSWRTFIYFSIHRHVYMFFSSCFSASLFRWRIITSPPFPNIRLRSTILALSHHHATVNPTTCPISALYLINGFKCDKRFKRGVLYVLQDPSDDLFFPIHCYFGLYT